MEEVIWQSSFSAAVGWMSPLTISIPRDHLHSWPGDSPHFSGDSHSRLLSAWVKRHTRSLSMGGSETEESGPLKNNKFKPSLGYTRPDLTKLKEKMCPRLWISSSLPLT